MKLDVGEVLHIIANKPMIFMAGAMGTEAIVSPRDRLREHLHRLVPVIHRAEKFIFDSGQDKDERTVQAVKETATAMAGEGLLHLPHPLMWVEDPFADDPADGARNFYLLSETEEEIEIRYFQRLPPELRTKGAPVLVYHVHPLYIPLTEATDKWFTKTAERIDYFHAHGLGEAVYSVKKLIVTLNSRGVKIERVARERERTGGDVRRRTYPHSVVHVPLDVPARPPGQAAGASDIPRRKHLVRGYVYGKHTLPEERQRWVPAYWRGDAEAGTVERSHYQV